jgi:L-threonylcarbamoyladenylate synthase
MTVLPFLTPQDRAAAVDPVRTHLARGGVLAYPTETVYGLGSRARDADVAALSAVKGRAPGKPFLLLVASRQMAERAGLVFSAAANALAEAFWPGPLTLILPGGGRLPATLCGPEGGFAVRWTSHAGIATLLGQLDEPLTSTSANRPGGPTAPGVGAILDAFADVVASGTLLILDGGVLGNVPPSTIVDCTAPQPRLVREGALLRAELQRRVGRFAP